MREPKWIVVVSVSSDQDPQDPGEETDKTSFHNTRQQAMQFAQNMVETEQDFYAIDVARIVKTIEPNSGKYRIRGVRRR